MRKLTRAPASAGPDGAPFKPQPYFDDPYLELTRLLWEAASLEHTLMAAYLFALFSIKDRYAKVRGDLSEYSYLKHRLGGLPEETPHSDHSMLDVTLEEMLHLSYANQFLCELGAAPNFAWHPYPQAGEVYPFPITLSPLTRKVAGQYMWVEADACALSLDADCKHTPEQIRFIVEARRFLHIDDSSPLHVGSVYNLIIEYTDKVAANPPAFLPREFPWGEWTTRLETLKDQGEIAHFAFFKSLYTGEAFGADARIWDNPRSEYYPALDLEVGTAFTGFEETIRNPDARELAWLADLHYWILLTLLDKAYRSLDMKLRYKAIDSMTQALWPLGLHLAKVYKVGVPFDPLGPPYAIGRDGILSEQIIRRLVLEAKACAESLGRRGLLPPDFSLKVYEVLLSGL
ncbi:MAG TPA: ferritin-like domain-containing protein [Azospirillum sp.]|nr:ferritin-like domain-containing protein [Azospirillum sp.]